MGSTVSKLLYKLYADSKDFKKGMSEGEDAAKDFTGGLKLQENQIKNLQKTAQKYGKYAAAGFVAGIGAATIASTKFAAKLETQKKAFGILLQDVERGNRLFEELKTFSAETPLQLDDITSAAETLLAFGTSAEDVQDTLRRLGDVSKGNAEKLDSVVRAFGKIQTRGKASMEELNMLIDAGVPIIKNLAQQIGVTEEQVFALSQKGKLSFDLVNASITSMTSEGGQFYNMMEQISQTTEGKFSTALDNLKLAGAAAFKGFLPYVDKALDGIIELSKNVQELFDGIDAIGRHNNSLADMAKEWANLHDNAFRSTKQQEEYNDLWVTLKSFVPGVTEELLMAARASGNFRQAIDQAYEIERLEKQRERLQNGLGDTTNALDEAQQKVRDIFERPVGDAENWWEGFRTIEDRADAIEVTLVRLYNAQNETVFSQQEARFWSKKTEEEILAFVEERLGLYKREETAIDQIAEQLERLKSGQEITAPSTEEKDSWTKYEYGVRDTISVTEQLIDEQFAAIDQQKELADALGRPYDDVAKKQQAVVDQIETLQSLDTDLKFLVSGPTLQNLIALHNRLSEIKKLREEGPSFTSYYDERLQFEEMISEKFLSETERRMDAVQQEYDQMILTAEAVGSETASIHQYYQNEITRIHQEAALERSADARQTFQEEYQVMTSFFGDMGAGFAAIADDSKEAWRVFARAGLNAIAGLVEAQVKYAGVMAAKSIAETWPLPNPNTANWVTTGIAASAAAGAIRAIPLAKGGYIDDPTYALIGEGRDDEIVAPLNQEVFDGFGQGLLAAIESRLPASSPGSQRVVLKLEDGTEFRGYIENTVQSGIDNQVIRPGGAF